MAGVAFHHIETKPFPPTILTEASCVEFATFYNVEKGFAQNLEAFVQAVDIGKPDGFVGYATGHVVEQITRPKEGAQEGEALVLLFGWESKEKHLSFRETELFAKHIGLLREKHGGVEMVRFDKLLKITSNNFIVSCLFQRCDKTLRDRR